MSEQEPTDEEIVDAIYAFAAEHMKNGSSAQEIQAMLVEKGLDQETAGAIVSNLARARAEASEQEPSDEQFVEAIYGFAAEEMKNGVPADQIVTKLIDKGLDQESAGTVVSNLARVRSKALAEAGQKNMLYGALWCIGGIVVTALSYTVASGSGGGKYVLAWGAIAFGAIQFIRGLVQASRGQA